MARRAYWPNMESIKAHLSKISEDDFNVILTAIRGLGAMENKLDVLNRQWRAAAPREGGAAASREGGMDPQLFDLISIPKALPFPACIRFPEGCWTWGQSAEAVGFEDASSVQKYKQAG